MIWNKIPNKNPLEKPLGQAFAETMDSIFVPEARFAPEATEATEVEAMPEAWLATCLGHGMPWAFLIFLKWVMF